MLGALRYLLAMMVACSHLWRELLWWQGTYAVFGFYVISGYLMTLVLNETYLGERGRLRYLVNRGLRIFPIYLVVFLLCIVLLALAPGLAGMPLDFGLYFGDVLRRPHSAADWFANLTLLPPWESDNLTVSQAWSLRIELFFYLLMMFLVRSRLLVALWLVASVLALVWQAQQQLAFVDRYTSVLGSSLAFSLGACIYHTRSRLPLARWHLPLAAVLYLLHLVLAPALWGFDRKAGFGVLFEAGSFGLYANTLLATYLLAALLGDKNAWRLGDRLGDLAYPVFLVHWLAGAALVAIGFSFLEKPLYLAAAFVLINLLALVLHRLVEAPVNRVWRAAVRRGDLSWLHSPRQRAD